MWRIKWVGIPLKTKGKNHVEICHVRRLENAST